MRIARVALVAAPLCTLGYGVILLVGTGGGGSGPGVDWLLGRLVSLVALLLFLPAVIGMARLLGSVRGRTFVVIGTFVGVATSVVQILVDIIAGVFGHDLGGMNAIIAQFSSLPGAHLTFYVLGPQLLLIGLVALTVMLALVDVLPWWSPLLVTAGVSLPVVSVDLVAIGSLCLLVGLWPAVVHPAISRPAEDRELVG